MDLIVKAKNIDLEYNGRQILNIDNLEIYNYDKIGIVGKNGSGKTTLLKVLLGQIELKTAEIKTYGKISYIPQLEQIDITNIEDKSILGKLNVVLPFPDPYVVPIISNNSEYSSLDIALPSHGK